MKNDEEIRLLNRITLDPKILVGKPTIRGYRLSVEQILKAIAGGRTTEELQKEYPFLEPDDVRACILYASQYKNGDLRIN